MVLIFAVGLFRIGAPAFVNSGWCDVLQVPFSVSRTLPDASRCLDFQIRCAASWGKLCAFSMSSSCSYL